MLFKDLTADLMQVKATTIFRASWPTTQQAGDP